MGTDATAVRPAPAALPSASSVAASTGQNTSHGTNATPNSVANLGLSVANAGAPSIATATPTAPGTSTAATTAIPVAGLAVAIAARTQQGSNQFEIRLDPPELGRIDVRLDVDRNGQATSHITVERADTLALLQHQQSHLERALEQAGLKTTDNGLSFSLRDQSFTGQNGNNGNNGGGTGGTTPQRTQFVVHDPDLSPVATTQVYSRHGLGGGVDIRV